MATKISVFILGTIIASFLSVLISRLQSNKIGIISGRSECPLCNHTLQWYELIPLLSFAFLKGKCHHCKNPINYTYPLLELITGSVYLLTYLTFSNSITMLIGWLIIFTIAIALSFYDALTQEVPPTLSIPLGIISLIFSATILEISFFDSLQGAIFGFGFFYLQYFLSKGKVTGLGDADIALSLGILLGPLLLIQTIFIAYILGAIFGIILVITKNKSLQSKLAFGPFLFFALFLNVIYQTEISNLIFYGL